MVKEETMTQTAERGRTDVHAPSNFDPADYRVIDYLDMKRPEPFTFMSTDAAARAHAYELYQQYVEQWQERIFRYFPDWRTGGTDHQSIFQCNHCGHRGLRWVAVVEHVPTGAYLSFGEICADRVNLEGRSAFRAKFIKDRAQLEAAALENRMRRAEFETGNADVVAFLNEYHRAHMEDGEPWNEFLSSLYGQLERKGELSEAQVAAVRRNIEREQQFEARKAVEAEQMKDAPPLVEGKRQIEGEIVSTKVQDGYYGSQFKMLVREDDGNKVWGTVPASIEELSLSRVAHDWDAGTEVIVEGIELRGQRIRFSATVERSDNDVHFGFFKRPTKAELIS